MKSLSTLLIALAVTVTVTVTTAALAQETPDSIMQVSNDMMGILAPRLKAANGHCATCSTPATTPSPQCRDAYADLFHKHASTDSGTLDVSITFGYTDAWPSAEDGPRAELWATKLTRECTDPSMNTCGFEQVDPKHHPEIYEKTLPSGEKVRIHLVSSSVSTNDADNRGPLAAQQKRQSMIARQNFTDGLDHSDMVLYVGHARLGGGPDFDPPPLMPSKLHPGQMTVNEGAFRGGDNADLMLQHLVGNSHPPKILGLFACDAGPHWGANVREATKDKDGNHTGLVASNGLTELDVMFAQAYSTLDSVLGQRCEKEFTQAVGAIKDFARPGAGKAATVTGFFGDAHPHFAAAPPVSDVPSPYMTGGSLSPDATIHPTGSSAGSSPFTPARPLHPMDGSDGAN